MNRRQFLHGSLGAALGVPLLRDLAIAQGPEPGSGGAITFRRMPVTRRLVLDAPSRHLQWLRSADEVAEAAIEIVCGGVCPTVREYPGHIDPARVGTELPAFVQRVQSHGLRVTQIEGPPIVDAQNPQAEAIIGAAAQAGCTHYSLGGDTYDLGQPLGPQLDAVKARLEQFVRLNEKHNIGLVYDTRPGADSVGGTVLDLLPLMREFDPKYLGFRWDTGHMALHGDGMWETLMRLAGPYVSAVAWRDRGWVQELGLLGEGGPYPGPSPRVEPLVTQPDGSAIPGTPAQPGAGGRGRGAAGGRGAGGDPADDGPPVGRGGRGGGGPARGPANSAGAGSIDNNNPLFRSLDGEMPKRPIGGMNAKGGGWSAPDIPMGMGIVHIPQVAAVLSELGFEGPSVFRSEYGNIGGAETGADRIDRPRQFVLGRLKRDVITIRKSFEMANTGVAI